MQRRTLLATLGSTALGLAGCVGGADPTGPPAGAPTDTPTDAHTPTETTDGVSPAGDRFADRDCPTLGDHVGRTVCYHAADLASAALVVTADPEVADPAASNAASVQFTLHNRSDWPVQFNPYDWSIHRREDDGWTRVAPDATPDPIVRRAAGETFTWELATAPQPGSSMSEHQPVGAPLDAGVFAFHVAVSFASPTASDGTAGTDTPTVTGDHTATEAPPEERVGLVALFELESAIPTPTPDGTPAGGSGDASNDEPAQSGQ